MGGTEGNIDWRRDGDRRRNGGWVGQKATEMGGEGITGGKTKQK